MDLKEQSEPQPQPKPSDQVDTNGNDDGTQYEEPINVNNADIDDDDANNYGDSIEADYDETYPNDWLIVLYLIKIYKHIGIHN